MSIASAYRFVHVCLFVPCRLVRRSTGNLAGSQVWYAHSSDLSARVYRGLACVYFHLRKRKRKLVSARCRPSGAPAPPPPPPPRLTGPRDIHRDTSHKTKYIPTHSNPFTRRPQEHNPSPGPLLTVTCSAQDEAYYGIERLKTSPDTSVTQLGVEVAHVPGTAIRLNTVKRIPAPTPVITSVICERGCWHRLVWQALWPTVAHHCALRTGMTPRSTAPLICSSKCIGILDSEAGMPRNLVKLIRDTTPFDPRSPGI